MAFLYINSKGQPHRKHSYSAGLDFEQSAYKYYLRRVLGWCEKDSRGSFAFGRTLEQSIQFHHDHNGEGAIEDFKRRWLAYQGQDLKYTDKEKDWNTCLKIGTDMIRLYIAVQPTLPIPLGAASVFQREYSKEVFPNDPNYGQIEDAGKLDIVCYVDPNHPSLAKVDWNKQIHGAIRPLIVDIKTSATDFPEQQGMAAFDTQLRRYSWLSGIRDVCLLWFKKSGLGYKKGYSATFINPVGNYQPGQECVIAKVEDKNAWVVYNDFMIDQMDKYKDEEQLNWLKQNAVLTDLDNLTRQRLQFNTGRVSEQSAEDAGRIAGRQIVQIVNAWNTKSWPNTFGIRYPKDDRNDSYFRAFVLGDETYKQQNFIKSDEQSFDDLFLEDNQ
jgi:hypothetical protein